MSSSADRIFGWEAQEVLGRPLPIIPDRRQEEFSRLRQQLMEGQAFSDLELIRRKKDGTLFECSLSTAPIYNESGRIMGVMGALEDITSRKKAEAELRKSEKKYRSLFNSIRDAILVADTGRSIIDCNPAFIELFGYSREEILDKKTLLLYENKEEFRQMGEEIQKHFGKPGFLFTINYRKKDGSVFPGETNAFYLQDEKGEITGFIGLIRDISEQKQAEIEKERLQSQLAQAQRLESVGRLAGGVAHDFNNLLSVIIGYSEMVTEDMQEADPHVGPVREINSAALKAKNLTRQLLAFSRKQILEVQPMDVNAVVNDFKKLLDRVLGEDIELELHLCPEPLTVVVDTAQLEQVLMNLGVNARDAMPEGGTLTVETSEAEIDDQYAGKKPGVAPGSYALIRITDTGCGMDSQTMARVFEPFFTTKEKEKGTGLGLATCYGIVKQHGGNIWVYSEQGQGTTFKIYLPLALQKAVPEKQEKENFDQQTFPASILIVEDDCQVSRMAAEILSRQGHRAMESASAEDAIEKASHYSGTLHLVITDVIMPKMKGPEVYEKIREHHPEAGVVYMSGYTDNVIARQGILKNGIDCVEKPFTARALLEKVSQVLARIKNE